MPSSAASTTSSTSARTPPAPPSSLYKDMLNRLEAASPGSKLTFVQEFLHKAQPALTPATTAPPQTCERCGMPSFGALCGFCRLVRETETRRERRGAAGPA